METPSLYLRELNTTRYEQVMHSLSDSELMTFFGYTRPEDLQAEKQRHAGGLTMFNKSFLFFHLIEKKTGNVIGWCGYHTWYTPHQRAEIGYTIFDEAHRGKGYMSETLPPVIRYGFEQMNLNRIEAFTSHENEVSKKLLLTNGFLQEGVLREHYKTSEGITDSVLFALIKTDWEKRRT